MMMALAFYGAGGRPLDGLVGVNSRCRKYGNLYAGLTLSGFQWGWMEALGLACWRQLSIRPNIGTWWTPGTKRLIRQNSAACFDDIYHFRQNPSAG